MIILEILFFIALFGILQTYVFYPAILILINTFKTPQGFKSTTYQPTVAIIFAAFNEEDVIEEKIHSLFKSHYPLDKLRVYIGSDASTDFTDPIVEKLQVQYPNLHFKRFEKRTGKAGIINALAKKAQAEILIGTDANIIFNEDTVTAFVNAFGDEKTQLVAGNIVYHQKSNQGISGQENLYLSVENKIKKAESNFWKKVMGVSGGLYAIRKTAFVAIPPLTFMEDFFISFMVLKNKGNVLFQENALGFEDTSILQEEEFKRKTRISIGNFQNLNRFKALLWQQPYPVGFAFLSHKILRWITPFLAITTLICALALQHISFYQNILYIQLSLLLLTLLDWPLYKLNIKSGPIRFISHFTLMNVAFLVGYYKYIKGVRSNVWQPTKRNQE